MSENDYPYFVDDRHALITGFLAGSLSKAGFKVQVLADDEGNHTDAIQINLSEEYGEPLFVSVRVLPLE